jgi:hypothetical protein
MKHLLIVTVGICLLISVPVMADQAEDEAAVRKVTEKRVAAFNAHDGKAYTADLDENYENWVGTIKGRAASEKNSGELFAGPWKNAKIELLDEIGIVFVTPDVAIYKCRYSGSGIVDEDGKAVPPYEFLWAGVWVKKNGKWLLTARFSRPIEE